MTPSPIIKVLSTMKKNGVEFLLMGGQACVFYGGAEFSRDIDFAIHAAADKLQNLQHALTELDAECIAVPPFEQAYLEKGHAVHFRCGAPGVEKLRIDVMSKMRGVDPFPELWKRRTTIESNQLCIDMLSLQDLILAKRTQRDKNWSMTNRLVEAHYTKNKETASPAQIEFWLKQSFDIELLATVAAEHPTHASGIAASRDALAKLLVNRYEEAKQALATEKECIVKADQDYWAPLKKELEYLRRKQKA